jgi:putative ABC transport system substrate-binding protein
MKRREFISMASCALAGAAGLPLLARAQPGGRIRRVLIWSGLGSNDSVGMLRSREFRATMRKLGWIEGTSIQIEDHWSSTESGELRAAAAQIVALEPDVVVTSGAPYLAAMQRETKTIPIVFTLVTDPVSDGFVASLARPGGNITGFTIFEHSFAGKWLEMLKEVVPSMKRVAVMQNANHPAWHAYVRAIREIASGMNVEVVPTPVRSAAEIESALAAFGQTPNGGLVLLPTPLITSNREQIATAALRHRLPSIYIARDYPISGGLMSYGIVIQEPFRQAATYADRILRGAKPAELPVQAANNFEMVINTKTAKALNITVPATMLGRADEVIE